ncbi:sensor histidine kinase [Roseomonas frigidaquae]|uniref:histidine kinase n=1 Tax=Falsiroseomonas frigidaquae TaxID=487318 RepID=A0ABX1F426_9PROT|nr:PAS domain-containing sensor histidine kinase [Falsiroseomonas frigidaquae]NKE47118.1 sensor histidine kinase [Falsiroseomonas frigidaquae]
MLVAPSLAGGVALTAAATLPPSWMAALLAIIGLGCLAGGATLALRLADRQAESEARSHAVFERAGISMWREDWTAVGHAIIALKQAGIHDMQAHFTAHPDEARRLRQQVVIRDVNAFTVQMMGAPGKQAFLGTLDRILPDTDNTFIQWIIAFANDAPFYRSEAHITRPDGSVLDTLFVAALPDSIDGFRDIIVTSIDITSFKAAQARLVAAETEVARAARISTIGALTAGIAHEVNSPLSAIVTNAEACLRWLRRPQPDLAEAEAAAADVIADATRARDVVARTRAFLSNSPRRGGPIDLAETVRNAMLLVERELRDLGASVHFDADEDLPHIVADPIQIQQVVVNLLLNGAQAMQDMPGPRDLTVTLRKDDESMRLAVHDRGVGIAPEILPRVFDPFYSTKPGGMGMGLAICRNCVEAHGGRMGVASTPGAGTTFQFSLPAQGA